MCPACITTEVLIIGGTISTGGLTALAVKQLRGRANSRKLEPTTQSKGGHDGHISAEQVTPSEGSISS